MSDDAPFALITMGVLILLYFWFSGPLFKHVPAPATNPCITVPV